MATLTACPRCRTAVPAGQRNCLRCGQDIDAPTRSCPACERRNDASTRFCAHCGHPLDAPPPAGEKPVAAADTRGVLTDPRPDRRPLTIAVIVLAVLALAAGVLQVVQRDVYGPAHTVTAFFDALDRRDAVAARRLLAPVGDGYDHTLLQNAALKPDGYTPPEDVGVEKVEDVDNGAATARVSFLLGGGRHTLDLALRADRHAAGGLFRGWRITGGLYPLEVNAAGVDTVLVSGVAVALTTDGSMGGSGAVLAALPGGYRVSLPDQPLWEAAPTTAYAGFTDREADTGTATLRPTVKSSARTLIDQQVRSYLDSCARSTELAPPNCPFAAYSFYDDVRDVHWKITTYPSYTLDEDYSGHLVVSGSDEGEADVTGQEVDGFGEAYPLRYSDDFTIEGRVVVSGNTVTFQATDS
jgi:hypothetical protein